ncbi:glycoside hydrolase family 105 protein [Catalinimonas alkaloidigena]|nr:glycoside hydrolase family 88 protein [Catalinimonas alkaloidigena]
MRKSIVVCLLLCVAGHIRAQNASHTEAVVRKIADRIVSNAQYTFVSETDGKVYASTKDIPKNVEVKFASPLQEWHYSNGVLNLAMVNLGRYLHEQKYLDYAAKHVAFGFENYAFFQKRFKHDRPHHRYPFGQLWTMDELDDFGAMGASVLEVYQTVKKPEYKAYVEKAGNHILNERLRMQDGTLVRAFPHENTLWADDLYMSVPFLVRMGKETGDTKYFDDAVKQVLNFSKYLWDEEHELNWHCYYTDLERNGVAHWGRCNGWIMLAQVHLLDNLPPDHPQRQAIIDNLERQIVGVARYQNGNGVWHQVLDRPDSYEESSATAMFVYGVAAAVNRGWIHPSYATIAVEGWKGLEKLMITDDGQMKAICVGTGIRDDMPFYYNRPTSMNEKHGLGPLLDAGVEILKLERGVLAKK